MKIAHIADPHLGYRAYHRVNRRGQNVREADVAYAFEQAIDATIALQPDLILFAGDIVHTVRPSNAVVAHAFQQITRLRKALRQVPILMIAGNHDSPKLADTGNILTLFQEIPGVIAVTHASQQVYIETLDTSVLCVPHNALVAGHRTALEPDRSAPTNILMLHGTVSGDAAKQKLRFLSEYGGEHIEHRTIGPERWDYVALGHYHMLTELAPNMWYAGALERTSTNIWIESGPKGFLVYDTETREARFHQIETRTMLDLPVLDAEQLTVAELDEHLRDAIEGVDGGIEGKLVRQVVVNLPRHVARQLNHARIREYRATALHFHLDIRPPTASSRRYSGIVDNSRSLPRRTIDAELFHWLENRYRPSSANIDVTKLLELANVYLGPADAQNVHAAQCLTDPSSPEAP